MVDNLAVLVLREGLVFRVTPVRLVSSGSLDSLEVLVERVLRESKDWLEFPGLLDH
jgi:hypothetical protein